MYALTLQLITNHSTGVLNMC